MKKQKNEKPSRAASIVLFLASKVYLFFLGIKVKYDRKVLKEHKDGFILISNHYSSADQFLIGASVKARKINFVVSSHYFNNKKTSWALKLIKAIKKEQFINDITAIRKMKRVIDQEGIVYIAPTGQVSLMGANNYVPKAIVKLVRLCKGSVVAMQSTGSHLCLPKWGTSKRRYPINVKFIDVINKDEISLLSDDEIYKRIVDAIEINEYLRQEEAMISLKGNKLIEGLEGALYVCPKCGKKYHMETSGNEMTCSLCGNTVIMNKYGFLEGKTKEDVCFKYPYEWYLYQKKYIKDEINNNNVNVSFDVILRLHNHQKHNLEDAGEGKLILTNNEFYYEGTKYGEEYKKEFDLEHLAQTPFNPHHHIEVPTQEEFFQFVPKDENIKPIFWSSVIEVMNDIKENIDKY